MAAERGGFLIYFDEPRRAKQISNFIERQAEFSDALSTSDWQMKEWEVCGLMLDEGRIHSWALARRTRTVATGKVRVDFIEIVPADIRFEAVEPLMTPRLRQFVTRTRSGAGGRIPPATWDAFKNAIGQTDQEARYQLDRLERLRDQSRAPIRRAGFEIVAQQRDAIGLALDTFDESGQLRGATLQGWSPSDTEPLSSFLEGLPPIKPIEDHLIWNDARTFPEADHFRQTIFGTVFGVGNRKLEVMNVNRTKVEKALGIDLLYFHEAANAWTLIQYKCLEREESSSPAKHIYRPDSTFFDELDRMKTFRAKWPDDVPPSSVADLFRVRR